MNDQIDIALLEKHMAGEIDGHEVLNLDGSPVTRQELDSAIESHKNLMIHLEGAALKSRLKQVQGSEKLKNPNSRLMKRLAAAAAILILGVAGFLLWPSFEPEPTVSDYFVHFDQLVTFRGSESTSSSEGMSAYSRRDYEEAFQILSNMDNDSLNAELN